MRSVRDLRDVLTQTSDETDPQLDSLLASCTIDPRPMIESDAEVCPSPFHAFDFMTSIKIELLRRLLRRICGQDWRDGQTDGQAALCTGEAALYEVRSSILTRSWLIVAAGCC